MSRGIPDRYIDFDKWRRSAKYVLDLSTLDPTWPKAAGYLYPFNFWVAIYSPHDTKYMFHWFGGTVKRPENVGSKKTVQSYIYQNYIAPSFNFLYRTSINDLRKADQEAMQEIEDRKGG